MKKLGFFLCAALIMLVAVVTCYSQTGNSEDEGQVRKVVETYLEGVKTKDLNLLMSVISPSFLQIRNIEKEGETGVDKVNYDRKRKDVADFFEKNSILSLNSEIKDIKITDNKATVETQGELAGFSLETSEAFSGSKTTSFFLEKTNQEWLIIGMEEANN